MTVLKVAGDGSGAETVKEMLSHGRAITNKAFASIRLEKHIIHSGGTVLILGT